MKEYKAKYHRMVDQVLEVTFQAPNREAANERLEANEGVGFGVRWEWPHNDYDSVRDIPPDSYKIISERDLGEATDRFSCKACGNFIIIYSVQIDYTTHHPDENNLFDFEKINTTELDTESSLRHYPQCASAKGCNTGYRWCSKENRLVPGLDNTVNFLKSMLQMT